MITRTADVSPLAGGPRFGSGGLVEHEQSPTGAPLSRRDLHPRPERRTRVPRPARDRRALRHLPRLAVVTALAGATIGVPLVGFLAPTPEGALAAAVAGPSTAEVLTAEAPSTSTSILVPVPEAMRAADTVSRSLTRDPLPECDGAVELTSGNGQIPESDLCTLWDGEHMLRGDAAVSLTELNDNFVAAFGRNLCITDAYRTLAVQRQLAYTKPGLAATPGTSNHGWGLAIDLCSQETRSAGVMAWLAENGEAYGWTNPLWARAGGSGAYEPWHWEYVPGTTSMGTNWDD